MISLVLDTLAARLRDDRGEVGPIGYAIMVGGIILIAFAVVAWGQDVADQFMQQVDTGGGDGGGGD